MSSPDAAAEAAKAKQAKAQANLATAIQGPILEAIANLKAEMAAEVAAQNVDLKVIQARLETLDVSNAGGKRPARGEKKTAPAPNGQAPAAGAAAPAGGPSDNRGKVKNSYLYCRWAAYHDPEFRETYFTSKPQVMETLRGTESVKKTGAEGTEKWWLAAGAAFWKVCLTPELKTEIGNRYKAWSDGNTREAMEGNLEADPSPAAAETPATPSGESVDDIIGALQQ